MCIEKYKVFIKTDSENKIVAVNSSAFLRDTVEWIQIDEGIGNRYHHAQGNYLEKGLMDDNGCYNYKLISGIVVERNQEEKQAEIDARPPVPPTETEVLQDYILDVDYRLIMMELGL
jgi:hypothetical protein